MALGMGWIDRHKRRGSVLALIALVLQIVLAFDHVHLHGLPQNHHAAIVQHTATAQTAPQMPAQNPADDQDYCAVCASIFLASSAFAPAPPQLPLPTRFQRVERAFNAGHALAERQRPGFRSRAPPAA
jgi:Protein of unknown function (DUF2946)